MRRIPTPVALVAVASAIWATDLRAQNPNGQPMPAGPEEIVMDRWLISHAFGKDENDTTSIADYLGIFEDVDFFPDRGRRVGTTIWTLHREDGVYQVDLDEMFGERLENGITFAHVYVWVPGRDRTLLLETSASCRYPRVVLNGHSLDRAEVPGSGDADTDAATSRSCPPGSLTQTVLARFAAGWNQILLGVDAGDGPYFFGARLLPSSDDGLRGVRIQASRPPGVRRGIPAPWITMPRFELAPRLVWFEDELGGVVEYDLVGWGRPPGGDVRLEIQVGGYKVKGDVEGIRALRTTTFRTFVPLEALKEVGIGKGQIRLTLKWEDVERRLEPDLAASETVAAAGRPVTPLVWQVPGALGGDLSAQEAVEAAVPPLPTGAGEVRAGQWKVPDELQGASLWLNVAASPGEFLINGRSAEIADGRLVLCEACEKGQSLLIRATSGDHWEAYPTVVIGWEQSRAGAPGSAGSATDWLSKLP